MEEFLEHKGFNFELRPNGTQRILIAKTVGCCRLVYNKALVEQNMKHAPDRNNFSHAEQSKHLVAWKKEKDTIWLSEVPS
jgi:putative transposase